MSAHQKIIDTICEQVRLSTGPVALADLIANRPDLVLPEIILRNGLKINGFDIRNGIVTRSAEPPSPDRLDTEWPRGEIINSLVRIVQAAERPIPPADLFRRLSLTISAVEHRALNRRLVDLGVFYIPAAGYWRRPQFTTDSGKFLLAKIPTIRVQRMLEYIEQTGYPFVPELAAAATDNYVNLKFLGSHIQSRSPAVASLTKISGLKKRRFGLYVPVAAAADRLPVSANVATELLYLGDERIFIDTDRRLFLVCSYLGAIGLADVRKRVAWHPEWRRPAPSLTAILTGECQELAENICTNRD